MKDKAIELEFFVFDKPAMILSEKFFTTIKFKEKFLNKRGKSGNQKENIEIFFGFLTI